MPDIPLKSISVRDVRQLRQAADLLADTANHHRATLVRQMGFKRYIFNALGTAAREPVTGCQFLWPDGTAESVTDENTCLLGEHLFARVQRGQDLPQAVITPDGRKYYL